MDAITFLNIILRLTIWFLLTANLTLANIIIGLAIALLLPLPNNQKSASLQDWLRVLWESIIVIPQAYIEAIHIMLLPHNHEKMVMETIKPGRTPGLVFLDIFLITFTPKTIVARYHESGFYEVHHVTWRKEIAESNGGIKSKPRDRMKTLRKTKTSGSNFKVNNFYRKQKANKRNNGN
ncbi:MAG: Na+/H+ antiporter subunit E [Xenococcaceae cyanobacterium MO_167.B27]|nr:Na+/H+ antiporter subunit E [Xenococcaceae cyanobacterium MO_167.B27]